jgi:hypothetical protein
LDQFLPVQYGRVEGIMAEEDITMEEGITVATEVMDWR